MKYEEQLLEFRTLEDRPQLNHTLVELTTDKKVYYDIWGFIYGLDSQGSRARIYDNTIKKWCRDNHISYTLYHAID